MKSAKNVENPELKSFIDGYLTARPNMEIIKVTDPENIKEIEKVIEKNQELKRMRAKRSRNEITISSVRSTNAGIQQQQRSSREFHESRLLSALAGHRSSSHISNLSRLSSQLFHSNNSNRN
jgi:hypothetical protein